MVFRSNPDPLKQKLIRNTALVVIVQGFKPDEPLRIDYNLVPHLMQAWKNPIRVTSVSCAVMVAVKFSKSTIMMISAKSIRP